MQAPVTKRIAIIVNEVGSTIRMTALAAAAMIAEVMKNRRGSMRSANPRRALIKVPTTNPTWTLLVNKDAWVGVNAYSAEIEGMTADAENHSAITAISQTAKTKRETDFECIGREIRVL